MRSRIFYKKVKTLTSFSCRVPSPSVHPEVELGDESGRRQQSSVPVRTTSEHYSCFARWCTNARCTYYVDRKPVPGSAILHRQRYRVIEKGKD